MTDSIRNPVATISKNCAVLTDDLLQIELAQSQSGFFWATKTISRFVAYRDNCIRQRSRIFRRNENHLTIRIQNLSDRSLTVRGYNRRTHGQSFQQSVGEAFVTRAEDKQIRVSE